MPNNTSGKSRLGLVTILCALGVLVLVWAFFNPASFREVFFLYLTVLLLFIGIGTMGIAYDLKEKPWQDRTALFLAGICTLVLASQVSGLIPFIPVL